jgi:hypothetical protein
VFEVRTQGSTYGSGDVVGQFNTIGAAKMFQAGDSVRLPRLGDREATVFCVLNEGRHLIVTYDHVTRGVHAVDVVANESSTKQERKA